jgi:predicted nuclease with TOPRIM domain
MVLFFASAGRLDRPFKSLGDAVRGLLSGISKAKDDLLEVEKRLGSTAEKLGPQLETLARESKEIQEVFTKTLNDISEKMSEIETRVSSVSASLVQQQVANDLDEEPDFSTVSATSKDEARRLIEKIQKKWDEVYTHVIEIEPGLEKIDRRSFSSEIEKIVNASGVPYALVSNLDKIVSLHKRFRSFSRMQATAELWMTQGIAEDYEKDANEVIEKLTQKPA